MSICGPALLCRADHWWRDSVDEDSETSTGHAAPLALRPVHGQPLSQSQSHPLASTATRAQTATGPVPVPPACLSWCIDHSLHRFHAGSDHLTPSLHSNLQLDSDHDLRLTRQHSPILSSVLRHRVYCTALTRDGAVRSDPALVVFSLLLAFLSPLTLRPERRSFVVSSPVAAHLHFSPCLAVPLPLTIG